MKKNSKLEKILKYYKNIALSDSELLQLLNGKTNIITYPELINYKDIDQILHPYGSCILLFESEPNYGHWCAIFKRNNKTLEFFNAYGGFPDDSLKYVPEHYKIISNQNVPYLSFLLYNSKYNLEYNEHRFQKRENDIRTCGRWCAVRILLKHLTLNEFYKIFKKDGDNLVTLLTMHINKK